MGHTETPTGTITPSSVEIFREPRVTLIARPEFLEPRHLPVQWRGEASAGERLAFSIMLNNYQADSKYSVKDDIDPMAVMLAEFTRRSDEP